MSISINTFKSCYIVGIGGSGMSSIAKYLFQKGLEVSGYDQRSSYVTNLLNNDGIKVDLTSLMLLTAAKHYILFHQQ